MVFTSYSVSNINVPTTVGVGVAQSDLAKLSHVESMSGHGKKVRIHNDYEAPTIKSSTATMQQRPMRTTGKLPKIESV